MNLLDQLIAEFQRNNVLSGLVGGSLVAWVLFVLRQVPRTIWDLLKWRFTCTLVVFSEDAAFDRVSEWIADLESSKRVRRMRVTSKYDDDIREHTDSITPGIGSHVVWYKRRPIFVHRILPPNGSTASWKRFEDLTLVTIGSSPTLLRELIAEVSEARKRCQEKTVDVYVHRHRWRLSCRKPKRTVESVMLPAAQKASLVDDIERFLASRDWYAERGVPYRRGYLFEGPPGTGKTTLALALAGHFGRPIYALNLGSIVNDDQLIDAIAEVPEHGILLIEDIDAAEVGQRTAPPPQPVATTAPPGQPAPAPAERKVTLSGLLNALDGVFARDGRILMMTTNHPEKVDAALLRRGRADRREVIGQLGPAEVTEMCRRFLPDELAARRFARGVETPIAGSDLQELLLEAAKGRPESSVKTAV